jgi:hypothetical protein
MTETKRRSEWSAADTDWNTTDSAGFLPLDRRGLHHGFVRLLPTDGPGSGEIRSRWKVDRPTHLLGALRSTLGAHAGPIARTLESFDALRADELEFQDDVWERVGEEDVWEPAGASVDLGDEREVEKVFAHYRPADRRLARDLYGKLSWVSVDERDISMRVRFSFGSESLFEWMEDPTRAPYTDSFADAVFPECTAVTSNTEVMGLVSELVSEEIRLSERIMYNNAPGGGAIFHHDYEPKQLGVVFAQLEGETLWLALPKRELVDLILEHVEGDLAKQLSTPEAVLKALGEEEQPELALLLNETPSFTRRLIERGHCFHLREGDVLLMPSHGPDDVCWHSVFALGESPSLALSSGVFAVNKPS